MCGNNGSGLFFALILSSHFVHVKEVLIFACRKTSFACDGRDGRTEGEEEDGEAWMRWLGEGISKSVEERKRGGERKLGRDQVGCESSGREGEIKECDFVGKEGVLWGYG